MTKVKTLADLKAMKESAKNKMNMREKSSDPEKHIQVKVAMATCGIASGAKEIMDFFLEELDKRNIDAVVTQTGCMGFCYAEPTVEVTLPGNEPVVFGYVDKDRADKIIEYYMKKGELIDGIIPETYKKIDNS